MPTFTVTTIVDGDTFDVSPSWQWNGNTGSRVRPAGFDAPEINTLAGIMAKNRLAQLLAGKQIQLGNAYRIDRGRLVCEVYFRNQNLKDFFPEWQ